MDLGLKGKAAAIAAASRGLGRATAQALAAEGCAVALCGRDEARVREAADAIAQATGARTLAVKADVGVAEDCRAFVARAAEGLGRLDILVTNTGGPKPGAFEAVGDDGWEEAYRVTLANVVHLVRAAIPHMRARRWGRIVNIASLSAQQPIQGLVLSNTLRPAIVGLAETLANELGQDGILVNTVCPRIHAHGAPRRGGRGPRARDGRDAGAGHRGPWPLRAPRPRGRAGGAGGRDRVPVLGARVLRHRDHDRRGRRRHATGAVSWRRPRALRPGDVLGVCAPAGNVDPGRLRRGVERLEQIGFRVKVGDAVAKRHIYTAGTVEELSLIHI